MSKDEIKKNTEWWKNEFYKYDVIKYKILMERFMYNHFSNIEFYFFDESWEKYNLKIELQLKEYRVIRAVIPLYKGITYFELREIIGI